MSRSSSPDEPPTGRADRDRRVLDALACRAAHDDPEHAETMRTGRPRDVGRRGPRTVLRLLMIALVGGSCAVLVIGTGAGVLIGAVAALVTGGVVAARLLR